jgi:hypothetical protein
MILKTAGLTILLVLVSVKSFAQEICNCKQMLQSIFIALENDYVDGDILIKNKKYQQLKTRVNSPTFSSDFDDTCLLTMQWLNRVIKDDHFSFNLIFPKSQTRQVIDTTRLNGLYQQLVNKKRPVNDFTGLWELHNGIHRYIVLKDSIVKNKFNVIVWSSANQNFKKGYLKGSIFQIRKDSFVYNSFFDTNKIFFFPLQLRAGNFYNAGTGEWRRKSNFTSAILTKSFDPEIKVLDNGAIYIKIPSFLREYKPQVDSLLALCKDKLQNSTHLIIDIRDNAGGLRRTYDGLLPYIYDKPIWFDSYYYKSSIENIKKTQGSMSRLTADTGLYNSYKKITEDMEANLGKKILSSGFYIRYDTVYANPRRISILINERTASASELFLMSAKQSAKVTVFGENSGGVIDRAESYEADIGCSNINIIIPIASRQMKAYPKPIDNIGIPPDVRINKNVKDWIQYAQQYHQHQ